MSRYEIESIVELAESAEECAMHELNVFGCIAFEDEPPCAEWDVMAYLNARIDMLEEELDESGIENALDWEKFPEYERLLYALAERELGW